MKQTQGESNSTDGHQWGYRSDFDPGPDPFCETEEKSWMKQVENSEGFCM